MRKIWLVVAVLLGTLWPAMAQENTMRIADGRGAFGHPNPLLHYPRGPGYIRMSYLFDTLVWKDKEGFTPALAHAWTYDAKALSFTFSLRSDAQWHDGTPLRAKDVVFTLNYYKKHPYFWVDTSMIQEVYAVGEHEVAIKLAYPYAPFLSEIGGTMPILPKHIWEKVDAPRAYTAPEAFIGSGPYMYKDFDSLKGSYLYEAFDGYYGGKPLVKRVMYVKVDKPFSALLRGSADFASIKPQMVAQIQKVPHLRVIEDERSWVKKVMINHQKAPFSHRAFRQALAYAIDREMIIQKAHQGEASLASFGLLSPDHAMAAPDLPQYAYNPPKALELLASLGYTRNTEGVLVKEGEPLSIEILSSSITAGGQAGSERDAQLIGAMLGQLGIHVKVISQEQTTLDTNVKRWQFDLAVSGHGGIGGDPKILHEMISSSGGAGSVNSARFEANAQLNTALSAQMRTMNETERTKLVHEVQRLHALEVPALPLYYPRALSAYDTRKGIAWFYTPGGIAKGIPIAQNKRALLP
jgi:peptide/nickel transport system substrate-binding protein